jgi:hypothetical protein
VTHRVFIKKVYPNRPNAELVNDYARKTGCETQDTAACEETVGITPMKITDQVMTITEEAIGAMTEEG